MNLFVKAFDELTTEELFEIYKLRSAIFVVEQQCVYQDIDDLDKAALHLWLEEDGNILSYLRILPPGTVREEAAIGRVLSVVRRKGYATMLLKDAIRVIRERFGTDAVYLEAQTYAKELYEKLGFRQISEEFLEDGIPHIKMLK
ncbi:MAG: GNAT family N-acetyltransferase [Firmicutes bacterium]|nr:GNAT family N-acetyltransferase [Bacillota bacterium]MBQ6810878.1 GNAT family N-acetyltransferase [Bacillota bacterium]